MLSRDRAIEELAGDPFDVVVIGGGITGAGVPEASLPRRRSIRFALKSGWLGKCRL